MLLAALVYAGDYLTVRVRMAWDRDPFDVMELQRLLAVRLKGKKIECMRDDLQTQMCVHALFPQRGWAKTSKVAAEFNAMIDAVTAQPAT